MKLLIITNLFPNSQEPMRGIFNKQQFSELAKRCEVKVVAPLPWYSNLNVPIQETISGIETYHPRYFMIPGMGRALYGFFFYISLLGYVKKLHNEFQFDSILASWAYPDAFGSCLIAKTLNKPIIIKVHGSDINDYVGYFLRRKMISWALSNSNKVIAVSNALKEKMIKIGVPAEKIVVIPNGVDATLFKPMDRIACRKKLGFPLNKKIILYVGNLVLVKGVDVLIDAFNEILRLRDDVILLLVGEGSLEVILREKIKKFGIEKKIIFVRRQPHEKICYYLNACDVFCLSSRSEGCPNVVLESMACGIPVVATRVGGVEELIRSEKKGILVEPEDKKGLANALNIALDKEWDAHPLDGESLSWTDNAEKLFNILKETLEK